MYTAVRLLLRLLTMCSCRLAFNWLYRVYGHAAVAIHTQTGVSLWYYNTISEYIRYNVKDADELLSQSLNTCSRRLRSWISDLPCMAPAVLILV